MTIRRKSSRPIAAARWSVGADETFANTGRFEPQPIRRPLKLARAAVNRSGAETYSIEWPATIPGRRALSYPTSKKGSPSWAMATSKLALNPRPPNLIPSKPGGQEIAARCCSNAPTAAVSRRRKNSSGWWAAAIPRSGLPRRCASASAKLSSEPACLPVTE
jgi:hypothetical protein